ncbi:hypothetical protein [Inquilinus sp.]|jgi:hypothetical protein|uniref:hypothetical protein n=1 Tax=Inquilinus sp. TaxID=1932117 RepID=UPI0037849FF7
MSFRIDTSASIQGGRATPDSWAQPQAFSDAISRSRRLSGEASGTGMSDDPGGVGGIGKSLADWIEQLVKGAAERLEKLDRYKAEESKQSPTGAKIIAEAERLGVPVHVLSDQDYRSRYPGTGGVTSNGEVYIPESALNTGGDPVLEHELLHAIFGRTPEIFDNARPLDERITAARDLFQTTGFDADDGERFVRVIDGWPPDRHVDADHVQAYVSGVDIGREKAGLPPLTDAQRDELYAGAAEREAALGVQRGGLADYAKTESPFLRNLALARAEAQWAETPQGRAHPPSGDTVEERAASLKALVDTYASEDRLLKFKS